MNRYGFMRNFFQWLMVLVLLMLPVSRAALVWHTDFESYAPGSEITLNGSADDNTFSAYGGSAALDPVVTATNGAAYGMKTGLCGRWTSEIWSSSKAMTLAQDALAAYTNGSVLVVSFDRVRPSDSGSAPNVLAAFVDSSGTRIGDNAAIIDSQIGAGNPARITLVMNLAGPGSENGIVLPGTLGTLYHQEYMVYARLTNGTYIAGDKLEISDAESVAGFILQQQQATADTYQLLDNFGCWDSAGDQVNGVSVLELGFGDMVMPMSSSMIWRAGFESYDATDDVVMNGTGNADTFTSFAGSSSYLTPSLKAIDASVYGLTNGLAGKVTSSTAFTSTKHIWVNQASLGSFGDGSVLVLSFDRVRPSDTTGANVLAQFSDANGNRLGGCWMTLLDSAFPGSTKQGRVTLAVNLTGSGVVLPGSLGTLPDRTVAIYGKNISGSYVGLSTASVSEINQITGFVLDQTINANTPGMYQLWDNFGFWSSQNATVNGTNVLALDFGAIPLHTDFYVERFEIGPETIYVGDDVNISGTLLASFAFSKVRIQSKTDPTDFMADMVLGTDIIQVGNRDGHYSFSVVVPTDGTDAGAHAMEMLFLDANDGVVGKGDVQVVDIHAFPAQNTFNLEKFSVTPDPIYVGDDVKVSGAFRVNFNWSYVKIQSKSQPTLFSKKLYTNAVQFVTDGRPGHYAFSAVMLMATNVSLGDHVLEMEFYTTNDVKITEQDAETVTINEMDSIAMMERDYEYLEQVKIDYPGPVYTSEQRDFSWTNTTAGWSNVVLPPWTAITNSYLDISTWNRLYKLRKANAGLPTSIEVGGDDLLTSSIKYTLTVGGSTFDGMTSYSYLENTNTEISALFEATHNGVKISTIATVEYDGFCLYHTELTPVSGTPMINKFTLEIPTEYADMLYYNHSILGTIEYQKDNPDNFIAYTSGTGVIGTGTNSFPWTPQITLSGTNRGICVGFIDERNWSGSASDEMIKIISSGDTVTLKAQFIGANISLTNTLSFDWYFQALPARPLTSWSDYTKFHSHQEGNAKAYNVYFSGGTNAPINTAINDGLQLIIMHQAWTELQGYPGTFEEDLDGYLRNTVSNAHAKGLKAMLYVGLELSSACPEWDEYANKMVKMPLVRGQSRTAPDPEAVSFRPCGNSYYNDFVVHKIRECITKYGIDGIFLDGHAGIGVCCNTNHGHGYIKADGQWAGTSYALQTRELMKRIYTLFHYECKTNGLIVGHGNLFSPSFPFMDVNYVGEFEAYARQIHPELKLNDFMNWDYFGGLYNQDVYGTRVLWMSKPDMGGFTYNQDTAITMQYGIMPRVTYIELDAPTQEEQDQISAETQCKVRSHKMWKLVRDFNPGDGVWIPFWGAGPYCAWSPPTSNDAQVVGMYLVEGDRALLVTSNIETNSVNVTLTPNLSSMGFSSPVWMSDPESTNAPVALGTNIQVNVPGENYRVILLEN